MQFNIPEEVCEILKKMEGAGYEIYIVGGAVRDILLGKSVDDWDYTTNATPEQIVKVFKDAYYDNKFGTVGIPSKSGLDPHEITTFRTESGYSDARRPDKVEWGKTLEEDLERRDFTINAMALKPQKDGFKVIDTFGGAKDLKQKSIKAVGNPVDRFSEDALRLLRAIRIATQLNFTIEKKTFDAIKANAPLINKIAKERVKDELIKIFAASHPEKGVEMLKESTLLDEILPEASKMFGVEQKSPGRHHIYDVGTHALMSLKFTPSTDPVTRFATFIHDIGKPQTFKKDNKGLITFYNHEVVGTQIAKRIALRLRFSKKETEKLLTLVRWHQFTVDEHQTDTAIRRFIRNVTPQYLPDMLDLRTGDRLGGGASETSWRFEEFKKRLIEVQKEPFSIRDLKINGRDVMKELSLKPGPKVGEILEKLFKEVEEKTIENEKSILLKRIKEI
ncbi:MAG TPA: HD domain-containing protein [Patescibacteria group bacterium]